MTLEPGYHVSPHVRLVRLLRSGGMGSVWVADHLALHTQVAVKFMATALVQQEPMVTRFAREASFAARIKSPHVVQIHDHGMTEDGIPFIVMELMEGEDLADLLRRLGPLSLEDVARIVSHVCRALAKAHHLGIVHRDIKLGNVFIADADGDAFVKLLDFGIAKQPHGEGSEMTATGVMVGTLVYMSPEQLQDARNVDYRSDLWSLAVVAYRALTGQLPFRNDDGLGALLIALSGGVFPPPSELRPGVPPEVDAFFLKALQRNPDERFASAREMTEEFDRAIGKEPTLIPMSRPGSTLAVARAETPVVRSEAATLSPSELGALAPGEVEAAAPGEAGTAASTKAGTAASSKAGTAASSKAGTAASSKAGTAASGKAGTAASGKAGTAASSKAGTAASGEAGTAASGEAGTAASGEAGTAAGVTRPQIVLERPQTRSKAWSSLWIVAGALALGVLGAASTPILRRGLPADAASHPDLAPAAAAPAPEGPATAAPLPAADPPPAPLVTPAGPVPTPSGGPLDAPQPGAWPAAPGSDAAADPGALRPAAPTLGTPPGAAPGARFPSRADAGPGGAPRPAGPRKPRGDHGF